MGDAEGVITTGVDDFIQFLEKNKLVSIDNAAKILHVAEPILQSWVDFLLEEGIIGIEYKFITPYVYLVKKPQETQTMLGFTYKEDFFTKARNKGMPDARIQQLWLLYLNDNVEKLRQEFFLKAKNRDIAEDKIAPLWNKYLQILRGDAYI
ncbi:MAG TPA: hypothetical protein VK158_00375 [Acidobacteriota bacterium]|nr:hypothetical protein [Acidobacteriota bacterium]